MKTYDQFFVQQLQRNNMVTTVTAKKKKAEIEITKKETDLIIEALDMLETDWLYKHPEQKKISKLVEKLHSYRRELRKGNKR